VLAALVARPVTDAELAAVVDDPERVEVVLSGLIADGLVVRRGNRFMLPGDLVRAARAQRGIAASAGGASPQGERGAQCPL
jgi:hypothetical protein